MSLALRETAGRWFAGDGKAGRAGWADGAVGAEEIAVAASYCDARWIRSAEVVKRTADAAARARCFR